MKSLLLVVLLSLIGCSIVDIPPTAEWKIDLIQPGYGRDYYYSQTEPKTEGAFVVFTDMKTNQELRLSGTVVVEHLQRR